MVVRHVRLGRVVIDIVPETRGEVDEGGVLGERGEDAGLLEEAAPEGGAEDAAASGVAD